MYDKKIREHHNASSNLTSQCIKKNYINITKQHVIYYTQKAQIQGCVLKTPR
jgi:hypothetical protein